MGTTESLPTCPFCGERFSIHEEGPCGQHSIPWFMVNHYCVVDIELLQKGGSIDTVIEALSTRSEFDKY